MICRAVNQTLCKSLIHRPSFSPLTPMLRKALLKSLSTHVKEHYLDASYGVYPIEDDSKIAIVVVANKYSPNNFWYMIWSMILLES